MKNKLLYIGLIFVGLFMFYNIDNVKAKTLTCCYSSNSKNKECIHSMNDKTEEYLLKVEIKKIDDTIQTPVIYVFDKNTGFLPTSDSYSSTRSKKLVQAQNTNTRYEMNINRGECPKYVLFVHDSYKHSAHKNREYQYYFLENSNIPTDITNSLKEKYNNPEKNYIVLPEVSGNKVDWNKTVTPDTGVNNQTDINKSEDPERIFNVENCSSSQNSKTAIDKACHGYYHFGFFDKENEINIQGDVYKKIDSTNKPDFPVDAVDYYTYEKDGKYIYAYIDKNNSFYLYLNNGNYNTNIKFYENMQPLSAIKDEYDYIWRLIPNNPLNIGKDYLSVDIHSGEKMEANINKERNYNTGCAIFGHGKTYTYIKWLITLIRYAAPILVFAFALIDYLGVVFSGEEKNMKEAQRRAVMRLVAGLILLFIPFLLKFLANISGVFTGIGSDDIFCGFL